MSSHHELLSWDRQLEKRKQKHTHNRLMKREQTPAGNHSRPLFFYRRNIFFSGYLWIPDTINEMSASSARLEPIVWYRSRSLSRYEKHYWVTEKIYWHGQRWQHFEVCLKPDLPFVAQCDPSYPQVGRSGSGPSPVSQEIFLTRTRSNVEISCDTTVWNMFEFYC